MITTENFYNRKYPKNFEKPGKQFFLNLAK